MVLLALLALPESMALLALLALVIMLRKNRHWRLLHRV
jgi:hypothetical protein